MSRKISTAVVVVWQRVVGVGVEGNILISRVRVAHLISVVGEGADFVWRAEEAVWGAIFFNR